MKRFKIYSTLVAVILSVLMFSCNDMNEFHEKYTDSGEVIYAKTLDSIYSRAGNKRIEIIATITNAFNVKTIDVSWDNGKESKTFDYVKKNKCDTLSLMIDNLQEGSYEFEVKFKDKDGNSSISTLLLASAYGNTFNKNIAHRSLGTFMYDGKDVTLNWSVASEVDKVSEISYTNTSNKVVVLPLMPKSSSIVLEDFKLDGETKYRTYQVPESTAIDSFATDWKNIAIPELKIILDNIEAESILGGARIKWNNTATKTINVIVDYVKFDNSNKTNTKESDLNSDNLDIVGLKKGDNEVKVKIKDVYGNEFGPITFTVAPQLHDVSAIIPTISTSQIMGGIKVSWTNSNGLNLKFKTTFTNSGGASANVEKTSSESNDDMIIAGMQQGNQDIVVAIIDEFGNNLGDKTITTSAGVAQKIDKSGWNVVDFSTEEATGEGANNGRAVFAIDDNDNTFWHSQWTGSGSSYPHHLTFDMGKFVKIASFEVNSRDSRAHTKQKFYVSSDNVHWIEINESEFVPSNSAAQMFATPSNPVARYFKLEMLEGGGAPAIREINIYGEVVAL